MRAAVIIIVLLTAAPLHAAPPFMPWNADVHVGDETVHLHTHPAVRNSTVYSGPQGAAYFLIRFFQEAISPQDGPNCRFSPTCSAYGRRAVERHGMLAGLMLACERIIRCNPYSPPGNDPVPQSIFGNR